MDFNKNNRSDIEPQTKPSETHSYFTESSTGRISVQTTSPFKMGGSEIATEQNMKSKSDRSSNIFGKKLPKDACSSTTSKLLINQIIRETNIDGDGFLKEGRIEKNPRDLHHIEKKSNYNQSFVINHVQIKRSAPTFNSKYSRVQLGLVSREEAVVPATHLQYTDSQKHVCISNTEYSTKSVKEKHYAEKTTYCRPVLSFNNEFASRIREKNARLQRLVKKLALARKREKEIEQLNNYINESKTSQRMDYYENQHYSSNYQSNRQNKNLNDFHRTYMLNRSSLCNDLLDELYGAYDIEQFNSNFYSLTNYQQSFYENKFECYPMSSQGRMMMINKERRRNPFAQDYVYVPPNRRQFRGNTIVVEKRNDRFKQESQSDPSNKPRTVPPTEKHKVDQGICTINIGCQEQLNDQYDQFCRTNDQFDRFSRTNDLGTQTSNVNLSIVQESLLKRGETLIKDTFQEQYSRVSENVDRLKKKIQETVTRDGTSVLRSIENKLDVLITSLNIFIEDVRSRTSVRQNYNCHSLNFKQSQFKSQYLNTSKSETLALIKAERSACGLLTKNIIKPVPYTIQKRKLANDSCITDINNVMIEEINNSNKAKRDIENVLNGNSLRPCLEQASLHIPTKDRSTEVTDSLSKSIFNSVRKPASIEEISRDGSGEKARMTIAVNTDPLGLLALLRISTETMKQLLSYMPNLSYYSYLQMIPQIMPQQRQRSQYVCHICGAAFDRPSQLSDHIQGHDLGETRDCCVCRHILDIQAESSIGLFRCQYCGQRFTRAYCCELHQESCAKRFGLKHDITPSLMLLR
ncbi:unnamed protein product [Diatraea saccharalis]|uniref:C2H2-type domain-containing protein n=1 Tax=Diatraea saccharalis TaxID=40085 RepID=A0A9N9RG21_9NEOP|nr:unnamed protein product [Diatraea saccharalis]